ncbi:helicase-exonuclease AddAB subunit AddB [Natranaerobius trueperi]|uniref:Helicase-exonuclease AddAB subunit AddB n=1 Tax=Natranaerobius trueperi TaxID=759412 RepID=A0A226BV07_9FIRM|nr:helicase-exonuclease AddAB subunit AddB [Natranaerobius trueperi]OWZ82836.1 helicase-exonuclease AddAB subunit AddB [Natranaerobius trueperi]
MTLRFLLGRSGSGKTRYIIDKIIQDLKEQPSGPPILLIVPEQATFQMEQAILRSEISGFSRLHILSFQRLSRRILEEQGGISNSQLTDTGKEMILKSLLLDRKDEFQVLGQVATKSGFSEKLARLISEAKMYQITPDKFSEVKERVSIPHLQQKLDEIEMIYRDYDRYLENYEYQHQEDQLTRAGEKVDTTNFLQKSTCYIDGFVGLTPQELKILSGLLKKVQHVDFALTLDPNFTLKARDELNLFFPTLETYNQVKEIAIENSLEVLDSIEFFNSKTQVSPRFEKSLFINHLEQEWGKPRPEPYNEKPDDITVVEATNLRNEIDKIAREIELYVRKEEIRYRDVAVITRDLESYEPVIKAIFSDYNIPFFIDRKESIHHHPLVEFIRSSLETIITNWSYEPVFRMLKTNILPVNYDEIFKLENYVLAHGIKGKEWLKDEDWDYYLDFDLESQNIGKGYQKYLNSINKTRYKITDNFSEYFRKLRDRNGKMTVKEISTEIWKLIDGLGVATQLESWALEAEKRQDFTEMQMHSQIWDALIDLFDQLVAFMGDKQVYLNEYLQILESGLSSVKLGLIPATMDQVLVGTAERTRPHDIKVLLLVGTSEGVFPSKFDDTGLIDDGERRVLKDYQVELAPPTDQKLFEEQFLIYNIITCPSDKLFISYSSADSEGKAMMPSTVITDIKNIFPKLEVEFQNDCPDNEEPLDKYLVNPEKAISHLIKTMNKVGGPQKLEQDKYKAFEFLCQEFTDSVISAYEIKGLDYTNQLSPLSSEIRKIIYPENITGSVSGLENYSQCPFKYFADQKLKLKKREQFKLEAASLGLFYHAGLKLFWDKLCEKNLSWCEVDKETREEINKEIVNILSERLKNKILLTSERYRYFRNKLEDLLNKAVEILALHSNNDGFYPSGCEIGFGEGEELSPLEIPLSCDHSLKLRGRIDRVDKGQKGDETYVRVIDYKGSSRGLDLKQLYFGLDLQLATYLLVTLKQSKELFNEEVYPAGMLYFGVENPIIPTEAPISKQKADNQIKSTLSMKGYLLDDVELLDSMTKEDEDSQELLPYKLKKDNGFYKYSKVLDQTQFEEVMKFIETKLTELGQKIISGEITPYPFKDKNFKACTFCDYLSVCQFDLNFEEHEFWHLPKAKDYLSQIIEDVKSSEGRSK